jgi:hypothetical protein
MSQSIITLDEKESFSKQEMQIVTNIAKTLFFMNPFAKLTDNIDALKEMWK